MTIEEIYLEKGYKFELEGKQCKFKMLPYSVAPQIQTAMSLQASGDFERGNDILNRLALRFLEVEGEICNNLELLHAKCGRNPMLIWEVSAQFMEYIQVFTSALPSFQKVKKDKDKAGQDTNISSME